MLNRRNTLLANSLSSSKPINIDNYLTIEALEDGLTAKLSTNACEYCIDGNGVWKTLSANTTTPSINQGQVISFRGNLTPSNYMGMGTFTISKKCNLKGNCMSMLFGDDAENNYSLSGKDYAFYRLFYNCYYIIEVSPNFLPATTLADYCYSNMFQGCTSITTAPELPATTLANYCYTYMFNNCTSLTTTPDLHATTLANDCYAYMFQGCTSITTAPELPATTLAISCYSSMFSNTNVLPDCSNIDFSSNSVVSSGGLSGLFSNTKVTDDDLKNILPINPITGNYYLPVTTLTNGCYSQMFKGCTSLTTAPELPATTLANSCYYGMFSNCKSLTTAPELPATTLANSCYHTMFKDCTSLTTASELPATTLATYCYDSMFRNCTSLTTVPELPATTLTFYCYEYMFYGCKKLNYIKAMFTTKPSSTYTNSWVYGVSSTGTFVKNKNATWNVTGDNGIPSGWTVQTA